MDDAEYEAQHVFSIEEQLQSKEFLSLLIASLIAGAAFITNVYANRNIVTIEEKAAGGLSFQWFAIVIVIAAILTAFMVYKPYVIAKEAGSNVVLVAFIIFLLLQVFWSLSLFHSRIDRGVATLMSIFYLAATIWFGWVCYHFVKESIFIFLLLLIWTIYCVNYTFNVAAHPYIPVSR